MAQYRVIKMLEKTFEAQRERALLTLELLTQNPAGIGDHSTSDFYNNAEEAAKALAEAEDVLETLKYIMEKIHKDQIVKIFEKEYPELSEEFKKIGNGNVYYVCC